MKTDLDLMPLAIALPMLGLTLFGAVAVYATSIDSKNVRQANDKACRWYASQNHEKEFAPERYAKLKDMIDNFDWYTACMNNLENPVAK